MLYPVNIGGCKYNVSYDTMMKIKKIIDDDYDSYREAYYEAFKKNRVKEDES